jgi:serine/threonine protein kinase
MSLVESPFIVSVLDSFKKDYTFYIMEESCEDGTLQTKLNELIGSKKSLGEAVFFFFVIIIIIIIIIIIVVVVVVVVVCYHVELLFLFKEIFKIIAEVGSGLKCLRESKIIHRNIKLQNLFIFKKHYYKIGGFSISKHFKGSSEEAKTLTGTPFLHLSTQTLVSSYFSTYL